MHQPLLLIDVDGVLVPANPIRTGSDPEGIGQPPVGVPAVGEHTRSVLLEAGYGSPEIDRLMAEGVVSE